MSFKGILGLIILGVVGFVSLGLMGSVIESVDADEICVIQDPIDGDLHWYISAGYKPQWFGKVTKYPKRSIYYFLAVFEESDGKKVISEDHRIKVRFNDAGHADMTGSIQYEMPLDEKNLTALHVRFGSPEAIQKQLVETVVNKSVYMTGPLMSSKESYAEKRPALLRLIEDQVEGGVFKTISKEVRTKDQMTGAEKTIIVVELIAGKNGLPERQEEGQLTKFGIRPFNLSITEVAYDDQVERQIQDQQKLTMQVQTAMAEARQAEQKTITVSKEGEANAAKAKWEQEVIKAKAVTEAQQKLEVARLDAQAAEQTKRKLILEGEGEATKRQLIMNADGALGQKLDTYKYSIDKLADAIKNYQGNWVPTVVMAGPGGSGGQATAGSGALTFMEILAAKAAHDLGIDMGVSGAAKTKK